MRSDPPPPISVPQHGGYHGGYAGGPGGGAAGYAGHDPAQHAGVYAQKGAAGVMRGQTDQVPVSAQCCQCKRTIPKPQFSKTQWGNTMDKRKCKECTSASPRHASGNTSPVPQQSMRRAHTPPPASTPLGRCPSANFHGNWADDVEEEDVPRPPPGGQPLHPPPHTAHPTQNDLSTTVRVPAGSATPPVTWAAVPRATTTPPPQMYPQPPHAHPAQPAYAAVGGAAAVAGAQPSPGLQPGMHPPPQQGYAPPPSPPLPQAAPAVYAQNQYPTPISISTAAATARGGGGYAPDGAYPPQPQQAVQPLAIAKGPGGVPAAYAAAPPPPAAYPPEAHHQPDQSRTEWNPQTGQWETRTAVGGAVPPRPRQPAPQPPALGPGTRVQSRWGGYGPYYPGTIEVDNGDGSYGVRFDGEWSDGNFLPQVPAGHIIADGPQPMDPQQMLPPPHPPPAAHPAAPQHPQPHQPPHAQLQPAHQPQHVSQSQWDASRHNKIPPHGAPAAVTPAALRQPAAPTGPRQQAPQPQLRQPQLQPRQLQPPPQQHPPYQPPQQQSPHPPVARAQAPPAAAAGGQASASATGSPAPPVKLLSGASPTEAGLTVAPAPTPSRQHPTEAKDARVTFADRSTQKELVFQPSPTMAWPAVPGQGAIQYTVDGEVRPLVRKMEFNPVGSGGPVIRFPELGKGASVPNGANDGALVNQLRDLCDLCKVDHNFPKHNFTAMPSAALLQNRPRIGMVSHMRGHPAAGGGRRVLGGVQGGLTRAEAARQQLRNSAMPGPKRAAAAPAADAAPTAAGDGGGS